MSLTRDDYKKKKIGRWYHIPENISKKGNEIKYCTRKHWWRWYFDYLSFKPDVVISFGLIAGIVGFFKRIGLIRRPLVLDWNDSYTEISAKGRGIVRAALLEYNAVAAADLIVSPSRYRVSLSKNLGKEVVYIPHGIGKTTNRKAKLDGSYNILYIGEQSETKRTDELVKAAAKVDCDVYLVGKVNEKLREIAPNNCHFVGWVRPDKIFEYINAADVCVVTDDNDSSLKMFEYIKAGKPILSVRNRVGYFLSNMENSCLVDDLEKGLVKLKDKKLREKIRKNVKKIKTYSWEEISEKYVRVLEKIKR